MDADVIVAGAGPVGMTLALDLAKRGHRVTIIEQRPSDQPANAKCNTIASRTMETFRRLGLADDVRKIGLDPDYPNDVTYMTSITGHEIGRIRLPSLNERFDQTGGSVPGWPESDWPTPEPLQRASQLYLEPVIKRHVEAHVNIELRMETSFVRYEDQSNRVDVHCDSKDGSFVLTGRFFIGCDGGRSMVRKQMGVDLVGDAVLGRSRSTLIRAPGLKALFKGRPGWMNWIINQRISGTAIAIDGKELWLLHRSVPGSAKDFEEVDLDGSIRELLGVDQGFSYEIVHHEDWTARRLVAERFRDGNVFIAGDAAHIWVPYAGYGMNAGIADAMNLSWMLSAVLQGWAPEALLSAHEAERHPITEQVSRHAMGLFEKYAAQTARKKIPAALEWRGPVGDAIRRKLGKTVVKMNAPQFSCEGLNFGYFYDKSPVISYDGEAQPDYSMGKATPSTVPGCRMPHFWMSDGSSVYDHLSDGFTLLRFDPGIDVGKIGVAMEEKHVPFTVIDATATDAIKNILRHRLILVRCDQHVVWRGDQLPADVDQLTDLVRGALISRQPAATHAA